MPWTLQFSGFGAARQRVGNVPVIVPNQAFMFAFESSQYGLVRLFGVGEWRVLESAPAGFAPSQRRSIQVWANPLTWNLGNGDAFGNVSLYVPAETPGLREVRILRFDP